MSININAPSYYTKLYGVNEQIYYISNIASKRLELSDYTEVIDIVGITPIIAPESYLQSGALEEIKMVSKKARIAIVSLKIDFDEFLNGTSDFQKQLFVENILDSFKIIQKKLGNQFDYSKFKVDFLNLMQE